MPACVTCYDCEWDEVIYAFWGTLLVFWLVQFLYRNCVPQAYGWFWMPRDSVPYSQLTTVSQADFGRPGAFVPALLGFSLLTLICTVIVYYFILNMLNYLVIVVWQKKEMCLKVWDWQTNLGDNGYGWQTAFHFVFGELFTTGYNTHRFSCYNDWCPLRLLGLVITTWLCLTALFGYWRYYYMIVETMQSKVETEELAVEMTAGGRGMANGAGYMPCVVQ